MQFARWAGAQVIATASARNHDFLRELGADQIIDYTTTPFEEAVHDVDVVFDTVGGHADALLGLVKDGGVVVSVVSPPPAEQPSKQGARFVWFIVEPNGGHLREIGALIDAGQVGPIIGQVFSLAEARHAWEEALHGHALGKIVLRMEG